MSQVREDQGWGMVRPGDRVAHYYRAGRALCGRVVLYAGELDPDDGPYPRDCATCRRKRDAEVKTS